MGVGQAGLASLLGFILGWRGLQGAHPLPIANYGWTIDQIFFLEGNCCWLVVFFPFFSSIISHLKF